MKELASVLSSKRFENLTVKTINKLDYVCKCKDNRGYGIAWIARETECENAADFLYAIEHYKDSLCEDEQKEFTDDKYDNVSFFTFSLEIDNAKAKDFYKELKESMRKDNKIAAASIFYGKEYNIYKEDYETDILDVDDVFFYYQCEICVQFHLDLNLKDFTCESFTAFVDAIYEVFRIAQKYKLQ